MNPYSLLGAGAITRSFIARLPYRAQELGPVGALSYRVASRIANSLRAGTPTKDVSDLGKAPTLLFCSNEESLHPLRDLLEAAEIDWAGKTLLICDSPQDVRTYTGVTLRDFDKLRAWGASVSSVRQMELPGRFLIQGDVESSKAARRLIRQLQGRPVELSEPKAALFRAGMTMSSALLTPLLDRAAQCFRLAGLRDKQAVELAALLFERTTKAYGHSGRQSWVWHNKAPSMSDLCEELLALEELTGDDQFGSLEREFLSDLILTFERMGRHQDFARKLKQRRDQAVEG